MGVGIRVTDDGFGTFKENEVQGYLAHKKQPPPLGPP